MRRRIDTTDLEDGAFIDYDGITGVWRATCFKTGSTGEGADLSQLLQCLDGSEVEAEQIEVAAMQRKGCLPCKK